jgi:hypothetical protein
VRALTPQNAGAYHGNSERAKLLFAAHHPKTDTIMPSE